MFREQQTLRSITCLTNFVYNMFRERTNFEGYNMFREQTLRHNFEGYNMFRDEQTLRYNLFRDEQTLRCITCLETNKL